MTRTETRRKLVIITLCICLSLIVPISQRAASHRLTKNISTQRSVVYGLSEEKISLQADIARMNTVETIIALGDSIDIKFSQIPYSATMIASN